MKRQNKIYDKKHKKKSLSYKIDFDSLCIYVFLVLLWLLLLALSYIRVVFAKTDEQSANIQNTTPKINIVREDETINIIKAEPIEEYEMIPYKEEQENVEFYPVKYRYVMTDEEFSIFVRCVEAEVTGTEKSFGLDHEDVYEAKIHVAQVILNRIESPHFPDTVEEVIFQPYAFSPVSDGRYYDVEIEEMTINACRDALLSSTPDMVYGCEFFIQNRTYCKYGEYIFTDAVGHSFFKGYYDD